jgi:hypothetical protein
MSLGQNAKDGLKRAVRRGMKNPSDKTQAQRAKLFAACNTPDISLNIRLLDLRSFSELAIDHARNLARCNQKHEARIWYRFICNSKILGILESCGVEAFTLAADLKLLGLECHPLDAACFTNDLEAIHHCLKAILSNVKEKPLYNQPVSRFDAGGLGSRRTEPQQPSLKNLALLEAGTKAA